VATNTNNEFYSALKWSLVLINEKTFQYVSHDICATSMPLSGLSYTSLQWCFEVMQTAWCEAMDACAEVHSVPESIDGKT